MNTTVRYLPAVVAVIAASALATATPVQPVRAALVVTWKVVSDKQIKPDGSSVDLYGVSPLGQLIYDDEGHMSLHLLMPYLPNSGTQDRRNFSNAEARAAFHNYVW